MKTTEQRLTDIEAKLDTVLKEWTSPVRILFDFAEQLHDNMCEPFGYKYNPYDLPPVVEMAAKDNLPAQWLAGLILEWHQLKQEKKAGKEAMKHPTNETIAQ